ncbi:uncharacterized protein LOC132696875 [Cylas formicarius]|uniref:uncharacterized protein LOC132696875 n=1 Tax=Cylas formicarius TaxID=197179 RepID=UPI00295852EA|nr:uncharacterized protein LOC132696875 [Cylas formicarius]
MFSVIFILILSASGFVFSQSASNGDNTPTELDQLKTKVEFRSQPPPDPSDPRLRAQIDAKTEEILRKIAQVNDDHGLAPKTSNRFRFRYPVPYQRSQYKKRRSQNVDLFKHVLSNPILEYLKAGQEHSKDESSPRLRRPAQNDQLHQEENVAGQQIKRKVTHYQFLIPGAMSPFEVPAGDATTNQQGRQNWNWPGANFFPIYIRDPFLQMYYAVTNMVEYGPNAGQGGPCKLTPTRRNTAEAEKTVSFDTRTDDAVLDMDDVIADDDDDEFRVTIREKDVARARESPDGMPDAIRNVKQSVLSPPIRDQTVYVDETDEQDLEEEKQNINVSNEGSKKVFSKDNTGNGIFVHRIRVRQGGVAIAGPGGIASAGDGGTAIVGPNGVAYTTRDGVAIVGKGTKVVGVDHDDLMDMIRNSLRNGTKLDKNRVVSAMANPNKG